MSLIGPHSAAHRRPPPYIWLQDFNRVHVLVWSIFPFQKKLLYIFEFFPSAARRCGSYYSTGNLNTCVMPRIRNLSSVSQDEGTGGWRDNEHKMKPTMTAQRFQTFCRDLKITITELFMKMIMKSKHTLYIYNFKLNRSSLIFD